MMGMWRRKSGRAKDDDKFALPTTDDLIPMETREQEELVMSFELSLERQSRMWKNVFQALFCAYIFFMGYSMYQQIQSPWELRYHAYFENEVDSMSVIFEDGMAIIACAVAIYGLSRDGKYQKLYILSSIILIAKVPLGRPLASNHSFVLFLSELICDSSSCGVPDCHSET
ncbi:unnamed protein product [Rhodiola kirilowii]